MDIPGAVTQTDRAGKPYTAYEISVAFQRIRKDPEASPVNVGWVLLKRYSEFKELLAKLSSMPRHRAPFTVGHRGWQWGPGDSAEPPCTRVHIASCNGSHSDRLPLTERARRP